MKITYIRKGLLDAYDKGLVDMERLKKDIYQVEAADEDVTIKTEYGDVLVTKGNYVMTGHDGMQIGITQADLEYQFDKKE